MPRLSEDLKTFIVQRLAMYDTPTEVALAVKETYGLDVNRQTIQVYDPTVGVDRPGKKYIAMFHETRAHFLESTAEIPVAQRSVRLRWLDQDIRRLRGKGNVIAAAQLMKQAAEDIGGSYTNRRELTGKDGTPLVPEKQGDLSRLSMDELKTYLALTEKAMADDGGSDDGR